MTTHLHHVHVFASNLDTSVAWYRDLLGGVVVFDGAFGGARNIFMKIGEGRLHLYDQPPRETSRSSVHHIGIRTDDLALIVERLRAAGQAERGEIRDFGWWRYFMCAAPDGVLLELFEIDTTEAPDDLVNYF
tara:strand:- start:459 stop:854 length:396 start_codon:yes stop_codon:yes gene_type:complete